MKTFKKCLHVLIIQSDFSAAIFILQSPAVPLVEIPAIPFGQSFYNYGIKVTFLLPVLKIHWNSLNLSPVSTTYYLSPLNLSYWTAHFVLCTNKCTLSYHHISPNLIKQCSIKLNKKTFCRCIISRAEYCSCLNLSFQQVKKYDIT